MNQNINSVWGDRVATKVIISHSYAPADVHKKPYLNKPYVW